MMLFFSEHFLLWTLVSWYLLSKSLVDVTTDHLRAEVASSQKLSSDVASQPTPSTLSLFSRPPCQRADIHSFNNLVPQCLATVLIEHLFVNRVWLCIILSPCALLDMSGISPPKCVCYKLCKHFQGTTNWLQGNFSIKNKITKNKSH